MLPAVDGLFTLVERFANRELVTEIAASKWLVQRHGLAPLAGAAGAAEFRDDLVRATVSWSAIERVLTRTVPSMVERGAHVAPIKGAAYARTLYDRPAERPMTDVDLLVREDSLQLCEAVLGESGFRKISGGPWHHAWAWTRSDLTIDVHRSILGPGRSKIDLDAVWSRTSEGWPAGARQLDPTDAFVFHLAHLARNRLRVALIQVVDAWRLLARLPDRDPAPALRRADDWGIGRAARVAFDFCLAIVNHEHRRPGGWLGPDPDALATFEPASILGKLVFDVATAGSPRQLAARFIAYGADGVKRLRER